MYWIWLAEHPGISMRQKQALLERYGDPEEIYNHASTIEEVELDGDLREAETIVKKCRRQNIGILTLADPGYPQRLKSIAAPPLVLFYRGLLPELSAQPSIGVVGTRKASAYGLHFAQTIASQLAPEAIVVSGGAAGIDSRALVGAMGQGGKTIAVLGCGVDVTYPRSNRKLFMDIMENGCLLSEYPPETPPTQWHFPARNRIISGICDGVLVVEAPEKSGALITAKDAMEQGRDVFVIPGNIDNLSCAGSNALLREGAGAVFSGQDILREYEATYPWLRKPKQKKQSEKTPSVNETVTAEKPVADKKVIDNPETKPYSDVENNRPHTCDPDEAKVLACITRTARPVDEVIAAVDLPSGVVLSILTRLTLRGVIAQYPGKLVALK